MHSIAWQGRYENKRYRTGQKTQAKLENTLKCSDSSLNVAI